MTTVDEPIDTYPHDDAGEAAPPPEPATPAEVAEDRARRTAQRLEVGEQRLEAGTWRLARALEVHRAEANLANPARDKSSDGTIGNAAHAANWTASDHNPFVIVAGIGVVRADDLDVDGLDLPGAFERARAAAHAGRLPQITGGGYLILNRRITAPDFSGWRVYTGSNPHVSHGHTSLSRLVSGFDSGAGWGIFTPGTMPAPVPSGWTGPDLAGSGSSLRGVKGNNGRRVANMQQQLRDRFPLYAKHLGVDGWWGDRTSGVIREFAHRSGIRSADGLNIGPQIAAAFVRNGVRP
jgi:hypothetical protein